MRYSRPWKDLTVGGEAFAGRDVFGESFSRISGFVRYGGDAHTRDEGTLDEDSYEGGPQEHGAERFVDAGVNINRVRTDLQKGIADHHELSRRRSPRRARRAARSLRKQ